MNFNRKRSHAEPNLTLNGRTILVRDSAKFLGMTFDERLTWKAHIRNLKTECIKKLASIQCVSHTNWGADRTMMLRLYRAIVRSKLDYGAIVHASANDKLYSSLDPVHNRAIRLCTGAFRSSSMQSLYAESGEQPLSSRRMQLLINIIPIFLNFLENLQHTDVSIESIWVR